MVAPKEKKILRHSVAAVSLLGDHFQLVQSWTLARDEDRWSESRLLER